MKVANFAAAIMAIAPVTVLSAETVLLQCNVGVTQTPASLAIGARLFTTICVNQLKCQHSQAPVISNGLYVGACLNCPPHPGPFGDCLLTEQ
ncbi:hypothetical protein ACHAPJ_009313 [Fusarium lateritium]